MKTATDTIEIELINPWTGEKVYRDITSITNEQIRGYPLDDSTVELVHNETGWATPGEWLAAYVALRGAVQAGREIIGS